MVHGARLIDLTNDVPREHALHDGTLIGRGSDCVIRVEDPMVALRHAEVHFEDGRWTVTDLGTRTGTFVGGLRITKVELSHGDELLVGPARFQFLRTDDEPPPSRGGGRDALLASYFSGFHRRATRSAEPFLPIEGSSLAPEAIRSEYEKLRVGLSLARDLALEHDPHRVLQRVARALLSALSAERALAAVLDKDLHPVDTVTRAQDGSEPQIVVSSTMVSEAIGSRQGVLFAGADMNDKLSRTRSISAQSISAAICVPMIVQDQVVGLVYVDAQRGADHFSAKDLELASVIAAQSAIAIQNARLIAAVESSSRKEAARMRRVLNTLADGVLLLDASLVVLATNERATDLLDGLAVHDPDGALISIGACSIADVIARPGHPFEVEGHGKPPRVLHLTARTGVATRSSGDVVLVIRDVTAERQRDEIVSRTERLALVGRLASGVAHDYNNVIGVVLNYATLLTEECSDPQVQEDAKEIVAAAERAADLTAQLLSFGRRDIARPVVTDVAPVLRAVSRLVGRTAGNNFSVVEDISPASMRVVVDPSKLERVLMNLFVNARDAMPNGGKATLRCQPMHLGDHAAEDEGVRGGDWIRIDVIDTGVGMTKEVVARAFEPFFTTKEPGRGTGLGLATSYSIVQQAGGHIRIDSTVGVGTTVSIFLPATSAAAAPAHEASGSASVRPRTGVVLVVDGDEMTRRVVRRQLVRAGHTVLVAEDAHDALRLAEESHEIDVVLTDLTPRGASGKDLVHRIRERHPNVAAAFTSAYYDAGTAHASVLDPDSLFLAKPFGRDDLLATVNDALRRCVSPTANNAPKKT